MQRGLGAAGCAALLAATGWLALAAAAGPSALSPPTRRPGGAAGWLLGPLHGVLRAPVGSLGAQHTALLVATAAATAGWLVAWATASRLGVRVVVAVSALAQAIALLGPPMPLTDVFNYLLYGRMEALYRLNPYRDPPLRLLGDPVFGLANWHALRSPYGPLFTWGSAGLAHLTPAAALWSWKVIVGACGVGTVLLTVSLARRLGRDPARAAALVGLSPVLVLAEVGGEHQDGPAVLCVVAAVLCVLRGRDADARWPALAAGVLVVAAAAIKPPFAVVVPLVVLGASDRRAAAAGAAAAGAAVGLLVLVAYAGALPDLATQGSLVTPLSLPNLVGLAAGHGGADPAVRRVARLALEAAVLVAAAAVAHRRERMTAAVGTVLVVAVLALAWVMPWYLLWSLPFLAVARARVGATVAVVLALWLTLGGLPQVPAVLHWAGYYPTRTRTGMANHVAFRRLVR